MKHGFEIVNVEDSSFVKRRARAALEHWLHLLPENRSALVLLKPNFNSNFDALTGNTTDLRILAAVIEFLQSHGYSNLVLGDGASGGFDRAGVSVIHRLKADKLAAHYDIKIIDFNKWPETIDVSLEDGLVVQVASIVADADFLINMPKLKTHVETGMSVCLKNLMGACVGIANKRKMHGSLAKNIIRLNEVVKPDLHIIDGLIAMEGNGPSRGRPVNYGKVIVGTNPFQLDYVCARLVRFPRERVKTIVEARKLGRISDQDVRHWEAIDLGNLEQELEPPNPNPLVAVAIDPRFQKHLIRIRYAPIVRDICSTDSMRSVLYKLGLSQERIREEDSDIQFSLDGDACEVCGKCEAY